MNLTKHPQMKGPLENERHLPDSIRAKNSQKFRQGINTLKSYPELKLVHPGLLIQT